MTEHKFGSHNGSDRPAPLFDLLQEAADVAFREQGFILVPIEPTTAMLKVLDEYGDRIWDSSTEHWFRTEEEAFWYARQVWAAMVRAARLREPSD